MRNVTYINAGAGSGKTYTLTKKLAEKLSEKDENGKSVIMPSQVILTTFTELAAAEFREKARVQILEKGNFSAAAQMDSAAIGTVHSVALQFIKKFWYLLDYGADIKTISERDEDFYMSQSLARIVAREGNLVHLANFRRFRDYYDIRGAFSHPDYLFWQKYLNEVVEKMEYYEVNEIDVSIEKSLKTLNGIYNGKRVTAETLKSLVNYLKKYYAYLHTLTTADAKKQIDKIKPILLNCHHVNDLFPLLKLNPAGGATKIENVCPGFTEFKDTLCEATISQTELDILEPFIKSIFTLAKEWRDDYKAYKKQNHIISYNDMEQLFLYLITEKKEVQEYVKAHYKLIMVDEFQDSNPIQLKIFNRLSELIAERDGHSYWVGDPKQAIYGFRGADTDLVNSVAARFRFYDDDEIHPEEGVNHLGSGRLVESWRSRKDLVELVNDTFYHSFKDEDKLNELCITLEPHFKQDSLEKKAIVHWECGEKNKDDASVALACKVKDVLDSKMLVHRDKQNDPAVEIAPKDIAILARTGSDIKKIVKALRKKGVPVAEPEDAIMQRIEVQLVVSLLQYMQNSKSKHVIADILRLLCGISTADILKDRIGYVTANKKENEEWDNWKDDDNVIHELLAKTERFKHLSIPEIVKGLIYECDIPALTAKWGDEHIRKQNLSTLQHLADDYDEMCVQMGLGTSISGFIYYLNSVEPDKEKDNQSNTVKVFTYHGSKGLEWPMVIMHGLEKDTLEPNDFISKSIMRVRELVLSDKSTDDEPFAKDYYLHFYPNVLKGSSSNVPDTLRDKINETELYQTLKAKTKSEERRLLYVGMTRAKDYLYTFGYNGKYTWLENVGVNSPGKDNVWGNERHRPLVEDAPKPEDETRNAESIPYELTIKPTEHDPFEKRYLAPSKIDSFIGYSSHLAWKERGNKLEDNDWGKDYATIGSCIHDIFAVYRPDTTDENHNAAVNIIGGYGLADKMAGHVGALLSSAKWLYDTLQSHFPQTDMDERLTEYPFQLTLESGQTVRGEMDLLWFYTDEKGKHCVLVDYKSYEGVSLNEHTQKYYPQLSAYAAALHHEGIDVTHTLLYYPVHEVIHELQRD